MYLRQSKDKYGNEVRVTDQRTDLTKLCIDRDWTWTEYKDNDFGASVRMPGSTTVSRKRPAYERMVADIKAGRLDAIAVWDADRLVRHPRQLEDIIDLADLHGLALATISGDFDLSTPSGRANARMRGVFARMEMEQKAMRQKDANGKRVEAERAPWWPSRPFGYDAPLDKETGRWWTVKRVKGSPPRFNKIQKHPTEAKLVAQAYKRFNAGTTVRTIATEWNNAGVKTPRGNRWSGVQVRALLLAERNAGIRRYTVEQRTATGKTVRVTQEVAGTWPALVSRAVWEQAGRRLEDPKRATGAPRVRKHLLSGIARCGRPGCGAPLGSAISSRGQRQYACNRCQRLTRDADRLDEVVIRAVLLRLADPDAADLLAPAEPEADAAELREERRALESKLEQLGRDFATAPPEFTGPALKEIQGKLAAIDARLTDPGRAQIFEDLIGARNLRQKFLGLDLGRQRTIVDALMTITVRPVGKGTGAVFDPDAIDIRRKGGM
jgi:DNA invertase Pin-like site-specific DNA recombinase